MSQQVPPSQRLVGVVWRCLTTSTVTSVLLTPLMQHEYMSFPSMYIRPECHAVTVASPAEIFRVTDRGELRFSCHHQRLAMNAIKMS